MEPVVRMQKATLRHRRSPAPQFQRISLELAPGLSTVLGDDGAGKSTLLQGIAGLLRPRRGRIEVLGIVPTGRRRAELMARLGYLPHNAGHPPGATVAETVRYGAWLKRVPARAVPAAVEEAIERTGLIGWRSAVLGHAPEWVRRRAGIAQQLVHRPELLLLDEPGAGLPLGQRTALHALLPALLTGCSIVITTRLASDVHPSGRLLLLHRGRARYQGEVAGFDPEQHEQWLASPPAEPLSEPAGERERERGPEPEHGSEPEPQPGPDRPAAPGGRTPRGAQP